MILATVVNLTDVIRLERRGRPYREVKIMDWKRGGRLCSLGPKDRNRGCRNLGPFVTALLDRSDEGK